RIRVKDDVPGWRNGRRCGLKIRCPQGRAGSTPALGTTLNHFCYNNLHVTDDWLVLTTLREMRELIYPALLSNSITDPTVPSTSRPLVQYHPRTSRDLWP